MDGCAGSQRVMLAHETCITAGADAQQVQLLPNLYMFVVSNLQITHHCSHNPSQPHPSPALLPARLYESEAAREDTYGCGRKGERLQGSVTCSIADSDELCTGALISRLLEGKQTPHVQRLTLLI